MLEEAITPCDGEVHFAGRHKSRHIVWPYDLYIEPVDAGRRTADGPSVAVAVESEVCCAEGFDHVALLVAVGDSEAERVAAHWHPLRSVTRQRPGQPKAVSGGCAGSTGFQWPCDAAEVFGFKGGGIRDKPGGTVEKLEEWLRAGFAQLAFACGCHNDAIRIFRRVGLCRSPDRLHAISG